jgi:hypothetical protein
MRWPHRNGSSSQAEREASPGGSDQGAHDRQPPAEDATRARRAGATRAPAWREAGHALEGRNREQLYDLARQKQIAGRSKMGKAELIRAIRAAD